MRASVRRLGAVVLGSMALLGTHGTPSHAQFMPGVPALGPGPAAAAALGSPLAIGALARGVGGPGLGGFGPYATLAATGYGRRRRPRALGGYGAYGMPYSFNPAFANPYYGYLKGVADVTTANAEYWKTIEQARLLREQSYRSALETHRKIIEEADWERGEWLKRIDPETNRQREQEVALDRARHDPPLTEILSARALNDLFRHLAKQQGRGERGTERPSRPGHPQGGQHHRPGHARQHRPAQGRRQAPVAALPGGLRVR